MIDYKAIAESNNFIILEKYTREWTVAESYQSEGDLERELIADLQNQGYEYRPDLKSQQTLLENVRKQLQTLNNVIFSDGEWLRFEETYLDKPSEPSSTRLARFTTTTSMTSSSTMGVSKTSICSTRITSPATNYR
jgi:type I site-specific restriction-modification system R (restriction) subunit